MAQEAPPRHGSSCQRQSFPTVGTAGVDFCLAFKSGWISLRRQQMRQVNTMANSDQPDTTVRGTVKLTPAMRAACAGTSAPGYGDAGADPWAAVITIEQLLGVGLTQCDLRWLVSKGYVRHACEIIEPGQVVRLFRPGRNLAFTNQTRFLLTAAGAALVQGEDLAALSWRRAWPIMTKLRGMYSSYRPWPTDRQ